MIDVFEWSTFHCHSHRSIKIRFLVYLDGIRLPGIEAFKVNSCSSNDLLTQLQVFT